MKIDTELRYAIVAAAKANKNAPDLHNEKVQAACKEFLKTPKGKSIEKKFNALKALADKNYAAYEKAKEDYSKLLGEYGLDDSRCYNAVTKKYEATIVVERGYENHQKFIKAGGKIPLPVHRNWTSEEAIRRLSAATTKKEFDGILKEYGIHWT